MIEKIKNNLSLIKKIIILSAVITVFLLIFIYTYNTNSSDKEVTQFELKKEYEKIQDKIEKKQKQIKMVKEKLNEIKQYKNLKQKQKINLINTKKCLEASYPTTLKQDDVDIEWCFK